MNFATVVSRYLRAALRQCLDEEVEDTELIGTKVSKARAYIFARAFLNVKNTQSLNGKTQESVIQRHEKGESFMPGNQESLFLDANLLIIAVSAFVIIIAVWMITNVASFVLDIVIGRTKAPRLREHFQNVYPFWRSFDELQRETHIREQYLLHALHYLFRRKILVMRLVRFCNIQDLRTEEADKHLLISVLMGRSLGGVRVPVGFVPVYEFGHYEGEPAFGRKVHPSDARTLQLEHGETTRAPN